MPRVWEVWAAGVWGSGVWPMTQRAVDRDSSFHCLYCDEPHPLEWRAEEHVIMRALGNDHLVLRDTCRGWNNFFARAFETPLLAGSLFGELCAMFVPGARPVERKIEEDGVIRRVTRAGVWEEHLPVGTFERSLAVRLTNMSTGGQFEAVVTLPEPIETLVVGHKDRATPRAERMAKRAARVVEEHVRATLEDPLRDPALHATLREQDVGEVAIFGEALSGAPAPPSVQMRSRRSQTSVEAMLKASAKSAWCYAALRLGRSYRVDSHGRRLLAAVKGCATPYEADQAPATLVDTLELDPPVGRVGVWRRPWAEVQAALVGVPPHSPLRRAHRRRKRDFKFLAAQVQLYTAEGVNLAEDQQRFRSHTLSLQPGVYREDAVGPGHVGTVVALSLFGGIVRAEVLVSKAPPDAAFEDRIDLR